MTGMCDGRVAIVTGAGRGLGREYAIELARHGPRVVANDLGGARDGAGWDAGPAEQVVEEIVAIGGQAAARPWPTPTTSPSPKGPIGSSPGRSRCSARCPRS